MSGTATFIKMPITELDGLRTAATPKRSFFGKPKDSFHDFLSEHGENVADYKWSGYVLATLLPYLEQRQKINLMKSEYDDLSSFLSHIRKATYFIFTNAHKQSYIGKLSEGFSESELSDFYNEFNATNEPESGKPMVDGIRALYLSLAAVDENSVVIFGIE